MVESRRCLKDYGGGVKVTRKVIFPTCVAELTMVADLYAYFG